MLGIVLLLSDKVIWVSQAECNLNVVILSTFKRAHIVDNIVLLSKDVSHNNNFAIEIANLVVSEHREVA